MKEHTHGPSAAAEYRHLGTDSIKSSSRFHFFTNYLVYLPMYVHMYVLHMKICTYAKENFGRFGKIVEIFLANKHSGNTFSAI
jgi:hypothetical protein